MCQTYIISLKDIHCFPFILCKSAFYLFGKKRVYSYKLESNKINNHITNLRYATNSENGMNKSMRKDNTSGVTGISWHKQRNKWRVQIKLNGKGKHIGYFNNLEDAKTTREYVVSQYYGEFAPKHMTITRHVENLTINDNILDV